MRRYEYVRRAGLAGRSAKAWSSGECSSLDFRGDNRTRRCGEGARKSRNEQAEQITAWLAGAEIRESKDEAGKAYVDVTINNASNQMVYDLIAQIVPVRAATGDPAARHLNAEYGARLGAIPPGQRTVPLRYPGAGMHKRLGIELAFQDAAGNYWFRAAQGALRRIKKAPANFYDLEHPVSWEG
jgi:hypothetical protein